uniref:SH2 domain containing 6 n=1 Tax=Pipistrellus kuhlii TaxID=59472 RepID=A0A7J7VW28_PIPKU|nr:SH2 domain containing 6 [Pipistrellus kuhlii]
MLSRVPCSDAKRTGPTLCAPARGLAARSPSPWRCCSTAGSSTSPSGGWMAGATTPWAGRAGAMRSASPPWRPWSSTTCSSPCPSWTDTVAAGNSPVCSSPPSPDSQRRPHPPLAPSVAPCPTFCPPWVVSLSPLSPRPPPPLSQALPAQMRGIGKGCPESERVPRRHATLPQRLALCSLPL